MLDIFLINKLLLGYQKRKKIDGLQNLNYVVRHCFQCSNLVFCSCSGAFMLVFSSEAMSDIRWKEGGNLVGYDL